MIELLESLGVQLALGTSVVLGLGALAVAACRAPHLRHRTAELTLLVSVVAAVALVVPLPRPAAGWWQEDMLVEPAPVEMTTMTAVEATGLAPARIEPVELPAPGLAVALVLPAPPTERAPWIAWAFLIGAALFLAQVVVSWVLLRRLLGRAVTAPGWMLELLEDLPQPSGARTSPPGWVGARDGLNPRTRSRSPRLLLSPSARRPFCCGLRQGTIVLPTSLAQPALRDQLEAVLRHEGAHLSQGHPRARALAALLAPLLYWQPLYWWLARDLRRSAELVADDMAVARHDKRRYVEALLALAEHTQRASWPEAAGLGALGPSKDFRTRMENLIMRRNPLATRCSASQVLTRSLCAAAVLGTVSMAWGRAPQDPGAPMPADSSVPDPETGRYWRHVADSALPQDAAPQQEQPRLIASFETRDAQALGQFLMLCGDARVELSIDAGDPTLRRGRVAVEYGTAVELLTIADIPGLRFELIKITPAKVRETGSVPPPLEPDMHALLMELQGQVAKLSQAVQGMQAEQAPAGTLGKLLRDDARLEAALIQGQIIVSSEVVIVVDKGAADGIKVGDSFEVYRGSTYKGRVVVWKVQQDACMTDVDVSVEGRSIEVGDSVTTRL